MHRTPGNHLHGGVANDESMQTLYAMVITTPHPMYSPPKGPAGKKFIVAFAAEWRKVRKRETNSEQALIFPACIIREAKGVSRAKSIKRRDLQRLALWG